MPNQWLQCDEVAQCPQMVVVTVRNFEVVDQTVKFCEGHSCVAFTPVGDEHQFGPIGLFFGLRDEAVGVRHRGLLS